MDGGGVEKMKKKKIAFYIGSLAKGGAERVIVNLAEYFHEQGYEVFVVTKLKEKDEYALNPQIHRIIADITKEEETDSRICNFFARVRKLRNIWKENDPDLIVSFIRKNNVMALLSSRFLSIPVVVSVRSAPERELQGRMMKKISLFLFHFADGIVLQTTQAKSFFSKSLQKKSIILPNPVNPAFINRMQISDRKKEIVTVGRIDQNKNQRMLVEAFLKIAEKYPEWSLHIYGKGEKEETALKKMVGDSHLDKQIVFEGQVSDVASGIKDASIYVLPSKCEGMPNALMEAMVLGIAPIATDCPCGGPADLIINGENGILIPVDDGEELRKALIKLMDDEEYCKKIGKAASNIVKKIHPDIVNKQWENYLDRILRKS